MKKKLNWVTIKNGFFFLCRWATHIYKCDLTLIILREKIFKMITEGLQKANTLARSWSQTPQKTRWLSLFAEQESRLPFTLKRRTSSWEVSRVFVAVLPFLWLSEVPSILSWCLEVVWATNDRRPLSRIVLRTVVRFTKLAETLLASKTWRRHLPVARIQFAVSFRAQWFSE